MQTHQWAAWRASHLFLPHTFITSCFLDQVINYDGEIDRMPMCPFADNDSSAKSSHSLTHVGEEFLLLHHESLEKQNYLFPIYLVSCMPVTLFSCLDSHFLLFAILCHFLCHFMTSQNKTGKTGWHLLLLAIRAHFRQINCMHSGGQELEENGSRRLVWSLRQDCPHV